MELQERVYRLLAKHFQIAADHQEESSLLFHGLNSLSLMHLIVDLETEFELEVLDEEIRVENFSTVAKIVQFIENNTKAGTR